MNDTGPTVMKRVCVFCGSRPGRDPIFLEAADHLGRVLVRRGLGLVYGGAHVGLMGRVADAVLAAGGEAIGVIPRSMVDREIAHTGLSALHIVASLICMAAPNVAVLGFGRVLQGMGAAAGMVVALAVVGDLYRERAAATMMSRLMLVLGAAPVLAPSLGAGVLLHGSWRWVFAALVVMAGLLLLMGALALPETLPPSHRPPLRIGGVGGAERAKRAAAALDSVGIAGRAKHRPDELSGGEQQRVAIARALAINPKLILADEPTAELDSTNARAVFLMLREIVDRGDAALVVATHDSSLLSLATRGVALRDGKLHAN